MGRNKPAKNKNNVALKKKKKPVESKGARKMKMMIEKQSSEHDEQKRSVCVAVATSAPIRTVASSEQSSFEATGVAGWLVKQCRQMGITRPSPVQTHCIPEVLGGRDVLGCAKTGTGKTLAFALPILQLLAEDPYGIFALILTPTRELAFQIGEQFTVLGQPLGVRCSVITGGRDMVLQAGELERRPHVVVCTPGRLKDHLDTGGVHLQQLFTKLRLLVLDEADRLLAGQYTAQLKAIFELVPKQRQTLLFSATITDALNQLHQVSVRKPFFYEDHESDVAMAIADNLDQRYVVCPADVKDAYLVYVVKNFVEKNPESSVLIFCQTCRECEAIAGMFRQLSFRVGSLHSQIRQRDRSTSLAKFRSNRIPILVSTDVASRGLDIPTVDLVICHNVPQVAKTYVHRIGRSARAGRFGCAVTFVTQYDLMLLQAIESEIGQKLTELKINDKNVTKYVTEVLIAKRESEIKLDRENFGEQREINRRKQMIIEGLDPEEVDAAMERQKREREQSNKRRINKLTAKSEHMSKNNQPWKKSKNTQS